MRRNFKYLQNSVIFIAEWELDQEGLLIIPEIEKNKLKLACVYYLVHNKKIFKVGNTEEWRKRSNSGYRGNTSLKYSNGSFKTLKFIKDNFKPGDKIQIYAEVFDSIQQILDEMPDYKGFKPLKEIEKRRRLIVEEFYGESLTLK